MDDGNKLLLFLCSKAIFDREEVGLIICSEFGGIHNPMTLKRGYCVKKLMYKRLAGFPFDFEKTFQHFNKLISGTLQVRTVTKKEYLSCQWYGFYYRRQSSAEIFRPLVYMVGKSFLVTFQCYRLLHICA